MKESQPEISVEKYSSMPVRSDYFTRSQVHRSPQRLGGLDHPQDLSFLDGPWYYDAERESEELRADSVLGAGERWMKDYESDDTLKYESDDTLIYEGERDVGTQTLEVPVRKYFLHVLVLTIVAIFLLEIPLRLPFALAFCLAIPTIYILLKPYPGPHHAAPESEEALYRAQEPSALYRRASINSALPLIPGTLLPIPIASAGTQFFKPSTYFPRATDRAAFLRKRAKAHNRYISPSYQPRRSFSEFWADLNYLPRLWFWLWTNILYHLLMQFLFRFAIQFPYVIREMVTGEWANDHAWFMNVYTFWYDWVVGLSGVAWCLVKGGLGAWRDLLVKVWNGVWNGVLRVEMPAGQWARGSGDNATDAWGQKVLGQQGSGRAFWGRQGKYGVAMQ